MGKVIRTGISFFGVFILIGLGFILWNNPNREMFIVVGAFVVLVVGGAIISFLRSVIWLLLYFAGIVGWLWWYFGVW